VNLIIVNQSYLLSELFPVFAANKTSSSFYGVDAMSITDRQVSRLVAFFHADCRRETKLAASKVAQTYDICFLI